MAVLIDHRLMLLASVTVFRTELLESSVLDSLSLNYYSSDILLRRSPRDDHKTCRENA